MDTSNLTASSADPLHLYENSVQDTEIVINLVDRICRERGRDVAMSLREDFCGTGQLSVDWVLSHPKRTAVGLDIDRSTLDWAHRKNVSRLFDASDRIRLVERNVLDGTREVGFDVVAATNFSYFAFHERTSLVNYLRSARQALGEGGFLFLDVHGGPDSQFELEEVTDFDGFDYVWEQGMFDPINHRTMCRIHYRFPDGTELRNAFTYDWRVWTIPELKDALIEAEFQSVDVWWEREDEDEPSAAATAENLESWVAYLSAWR